MGDRPAAGCYTCLLPILSVQLQLQREEEQRCRCRPRLRALDSGHFQIQSQCRIAARNE